MVFAFLFGLSMDYEVFILSRIREEYDGGALDRRGRHRGHRPHRPAGHERGADPVPRLRRARLRAGHRPQDAGHRARLRHPARRDHRALGARAVAGLAVRPVELVPARRRRARAAGRSRRTPHAVTGAASSPEPGRVAGEALSDRPVGRYGRVDAADRASTCPASTSPRSRGWLDAERPGLRQGELDGEVIAGGKSNLTYRITDG